MRFSQLFTTLALSISIAGVAQARDQLSLAGSSTVLPFATIVAEELGKNPQFKTPIVESTGSGGGLKLFERSLGAMFHILS